MREQKYHVYLTADEQSRVIQSLIRLKNELIEQGRYTDAVDDVLCKVVSAKKNDEYYGAAEPPVRCGESHLSGLTEPPQFVY